MRPTLAAIAAILAIGASPAMADDTESRTAVEAFYAVFNEGAVDRLPDLVTEDYVLHGTSPALPDGDAAAVAKALADFAAGVPDARYEIEAMRVAGDFVTVRGTITGTHDGQLFGMPATGRPIEFGAIDIHRVEDGRVAESWHVEDFATMLRQVGALPGG